MISENPKIGFIGFGEVAYYLSKGLKGAGIKQIKAVDQPIYSEIVRNRARDAEVELALTLEELVMRSELLISAVWGNLSLEVAREAAHFMTSDKMFADLNNSSPRAKKLAAEAINAKGAKFIDIGLMAIPKEEGHKALMYVSGDGAEEFKAIMSKYGMNIQIVPGEAGKAMTIKTLWSIHTKGTQALLWELVLAAHKVGVDLSAHEPLIQKTAMGDLVFSIPQWLVMHAGLHAERKSNELREIAEAMREWGIEPIVIEAAAKRLESVARYSLKDYFKAEMPAEGYQAMLKAIDKISKEAEISVR
ncbi:MAG: hypothetical protein DDT29_02241 [Dehalococcoidia bacterium]|nr:hypothetical protein [Bacillota bacterium]